MWSRDGSSIFFRNRTEVLSVAVKTSPDFSASEPQLLFEGSFAGGDWWKAAFDISEDGHRFLMIQSSPEDVSARNLKVVLNWFEELEAEAAP